MIEGSKVLLVDDNGEIVDILTDFLSMNGCVIYSASTGKEALEALDSTEIEIVILDIRLPDISGISLLDTIKIKNPTVGVIMITGYHDPNLIVEAMKKGASDFLIKPFEFDKLIFVMMRVIRERKLLIEKQNILESLEDKKKIELLNRELQKKIQELTTMYHISNRFNSLNVLDDVYEKMIRIINEILDATSCYYIVDTEKNELMLYKELSVGNGDFNPKRLAISNGLLEEAFSPRRYHIEGDKAFLPLLIKGEYIGFVAVTGKGLKGTNKGSFSDSDLFFLKLITEKASTQIENRMLYESLFEGVLHTLTSLILAINRRDSYTEDHCKRVTQMSLALSERLGLNGYEKDVLRVVGPIHDVGKVGIPDAILLKPASLTNEEYAIIKAHSLYGEDIMNKFEILSNEARIIRHHHERFDGAGYPDGLSGEDIPSCSRIIAVCDTYDAMATNRPYRNALTRQEVMAEIMRCKGGQLDPALTDCFVEMINDDGEWDG
ncbi:MAG: Cyclic di-GMP phosphodiesterase response regulator RpfG [Syntrophorhabdus sp. PtaU1.Bin153]|nr:MAG: Cyclic di-GMP phosphodiesterase response regulator RpfG [Syntrophorhabdus sp. PtaU1.Bin153]